MLARAERELFCKIRIADDMSADVRLPAHVPLDFDGDELAACFDLCLALWQRSIDREALIALTRNFMRAEKVSDTDRLAFKRARARFKHLRFAHALYGTRRAHPPLLNLVTVVMGRAQDELNTGRRRALFAHALFLRILLSAPVVRYLRREVSRLIPVSPATFRESLLDDADTMTRFVADGATSGRKLHAARKVIGRQRSFWDTLRTIAPTPVRRDLATELGAINTLMGDLHDTLVAHRAEESASYAARFDLPHAIRRRILNLSTRYRERNTSR